MNKVLVFFLAICGFSLSFGQAVKKDVRIEQVGAGDARTADYINRSSQAIAMEEKNCAEEHIGTILFHNQTKKDLSLVITDARKEVVSTIEVKAGASTYVKDIEIGEYYYKNESSKKGKKKQIINVLECMLKTVVLDDKNTK